MKTLPDIEKNDIISYISAYGGGTSFGIVERIKQVGTNTLIYCRWFDTLENAIQDKNAQWIGTYIDFPKYEITVEKKTKITNWQEEFQK